MTRSFDVVELACFRASLPRKIPILGWSYEVVLASPSNITGVLIALCILCAPLKFFRVALRIALQLWLLNLPLNHDVKF